MVSTTLNQISFHNLYPFTSHFQYSQFSVFHFQRVNTDSNRYHSTFYQCLCCTVRCGAYKSSLYSNKSILFLLYPLFYHTARYTVPWAVFNILPDVNLYSCKLFLLLAIHPGKNLQHEIQTTFSKDPCFRITAPYNFGKSACMYMRQKLAQIVLQVI